MGGQDFSGKQVDRYLLSTLIGCGAAGGVYQAVDISLENSPTFAIKCVRESDVRKKWRQQLAEIHNHNAVVRCPNVLMLYDVIEDDGYFFFVLPLCETDMFRAIWREKVYWRNDSLIKGVFIDILDGVFACHNQGIFHRDLKPENIMCHADGTNIQLGDFGLSTNRRLCRDGGCGTASYMSPECLDKSGVFYYADPADIWSLGVILFNMVTCRYPWEEARPMDKEYQAFLSKEDYFLRTYPISEPLSALLCRIWHPTPLRRLSIPAIRQAILEMDTFYNLPLGPSPAASPISKELFLVDSQQTFVAPDVEDEKKKDYCAPIDFLHEISLCPLV